jgi:hypothetical protein
MFLPRRQPNFIVFRTFPVTEMGAMQNKPSSTAHLDAYVECDACGKWRFVEAEHAVRFPLPHSKYNFSSSSSSLEYIAKIMLSRCSCSSKSPDCISFLMWCKVQVAWSTVFSIFKGEQAQGGARAGCPAKIMSLAVTWPLLVCCCCVHEAQCQAPPPRAC